MGDFRKFCFAYFITTSGLAAGQNHGLWEPVKDGAAGLMLIGSILASMFIMWFGKKKPEQPQ